MPKRKKGGHNNTRSKNASKTIEIKYKNVELGEKYARVTQPRGSCKFTVETLDGTLIHTSLTGKLRKRGRINVGDLVLIEPLTENDSGNHIIIFKYTKSQEKILSNEGQLAVVVEQKADVEDLGYQFEGDEEVKVEKVVEINEDMIDNI